MFFIRFILENISISHHTMALKDSVRRYRWLLAYQKQLWVAVLDCYFSFKNLRLLVLFKNIWSYKEAKDCHQWRLFHNYWVNGYENTCVLFCLSHFLVQLCRKTESVLLHDLIPESITSSLRYKILLSERKFSSVSWKCKLCMK